MKNILLIDGENFKGKIKEVFKIVGKDKPVWHRYNFAALLEKVLSGIDFERRVFYFARIKEHKESRDKSRQLIEEQRHLKTHLENQGFEVILSGRVRGQYEGMGQIKSLVFKEKGVDVRVAVDMVTAACDKVVDEIFLGSSDSDLQPAVKEVTTRGVICNYLGFEISPNKGLSYTTKRTILIRNSEVLEFESVENKLL
jgi:uncharacterized LabA/DUF88 family protein